MTISTLAFGKASAAESLKLSQQVLRFYSTAPAIAPTNGNSVPIRPVDPAVQRELFMNVLNANATRRDAKQYLARFKSLKPKEPPPPPKLSPVQEERNARHRKDQDRLERLGVNLGELYAPARAIAESPQFSQPGVHDKSDVEAHPKVHVALVCLRNPETLDDTTLDSVALTLSQLVKLDMRIMVVLDCSEDSYASDLNSGPEKLSAIKVKFAEQGERLTKAIAKHSLEGARVVAGALETDEAMLAEHDHMAAPSTSVGLPKLLMEPLKRTVIPIVPSIAYMPSGQLLPAPVASTMGALTNMLSGLPTSKATDPPTMETSLDRIILLDPAGGIPSKARGDGAHVFINLEQEFEEIDAELADYGDETTRSEHGPRMLDTYEQHRTNLNILHRCLARLPSASSALIITPQEAASSSQAGESDDSTIGAGTRRQKNTLIHNLLTNKPMVSSSLPAARLQMTANSSDGITAATTPSATIVKRGMSLTLIPPPDRNLGWGLPSTGTTSLSLENDPRVDFPRLLHLIEDSFRRKLDVKDYLSRINTHIAGLIVAGSYEGGALLTWEMPPGTSDPTRLVPYLDKFAVLSSSQGSSGVADIVFQAMVRSCFPAGVCWRSRKDNPVNKWYFERSDGTWQIPGTNWTMFWTGEGVVESTQRWEDYVGVCANVKPSWADGKKPD